MSRAGADEISKTDIKLTKKETGSAKLQRNAKVPKYDGGKIKHEDMLTSCSVSREKFMHEKNDDKKQKRFGK